MLSFHLVFLFPLLDLLTPSNSGAVCGYEDPSHPTNSTYVCVCGTYEACHSETIQCPANSTCRVECTVSAACYAANIQWPQSPGSGTLICDGGRSACQGVNFPIPSPYENFSFHCDQEKDCLRADIYCPEFANCHITCSATRACWDTIIHWSPNDVQSTLSCTYGGDECTGTNLPPSKSPSLYPTIPPTTATFDPTQPPTNNPTSATADPTVHPTEPTVAPITTDPTIVTMDPTTAPVPSPTSVTLTPTTSPTARPTVPPSIAPSLQPSLQPTPAPVCGYEDPPINSVYVCLCHGHLSCDRENIVCPDNSICRVECNGDAACYGSSVEWPTAPGSGTLTCARRNACRNMNFPIPDPYQDVFIDCDWEATCSNTDIYCPDWANCHIMCSADFACIDATIHWSPNAVQSTLSCTFGNNECLRTNVPPTPEPTMNPSPDPTDATSHPTSSPTYHPTILSLNPTSTPSLLPTSSPTVHPTMEPTLLPTLEPTFQPTLNPSTQPTVYPTTAPTIYPTLNPTNHPTNPTAEPIVVPTMNPTRDPTLDPTKAPSKFPTLSPTEPPSLHPSKYPTSNPTQNPTAHPTKPPTKYPTADPTIPTITPSQTPTVSPTWTLTTSQFGSSDAPNPPSVVRAAEQGLDPVVIIGILSTVIVVICFCGCCVFMTMVLKNQNLVVMLQKDVNDGSPHENDNERREISHENDNVISPELPEDDEGDIPGMGVVHHDTIGEHDIDTAGEDEEENEGRKMTNMDDRKPVDGNETNSRWLPTGTIQLTGFIDADTTPVTSTTPRGIELMDIAAYAIPKSPSLAKKAQTDVLEVQNWVETVLRLPQYFDIFISNGYESMNIIKDIPDANELKEIGIVLKGHQRKILREIEAWKSKHGNV